MKITLDLPEALLRTLKIRAVKEEKTFKGLMAELMSSGLAALKAQEAGAKKPVKTKARP